MNPDHEPDEMTDTPAEGNGHARSLFREQVKQLVGDVSEIRSALLGDLAKPIGLFGRVASLEWRVKWLWVAMLAALGALVTLGWTTITAKAKPQAFRDSTSDRHWDRMPR